MADGTSFTGSDNLPKNDATFESDSMDEVDFPLAAEGTRRPLTIEDIAQAASVSRSTVSRVINHHPSVRPLVRQRVETVIAALRYSPSAAARSLASRRTDAVGLLIPRSAAAIFADPFFPHVIQGVTETCSRRGYFLMLSMVTAEREHDYYESVIAGHHVD